MENRIKVVIDYSTCEVKTLDSSVRNYDIIFETYWDMQGFYIKLERDLETIEHMFTNADLKYFIINLNKRSNLNLNEIFISSNELNIDTFLVLLLEQVSYLAISNTRMELNRIIDDACVETIVHLLSCFKFEFNSSLAHAV